ncbi:hemagglutinin/amebocyte aggregation factor-like [Dendronephthya gigantea]|uniref:hemagglutinin/amebocyte aggregation factor-like n=1 Tax=Dendronephthya gigantea TaxID=151771 RepID=UPI00106AE854|nr:hemagglutinin/amebocyte aggregation factor-like [Dendronephthya gigantea]
MMQVAFVFLIFLVNVMSIHAGTDFDKTWTFTCPHGQSINHISSVHSNRHEDRSWTFRCRYSSKIAATCYWTGWVNAYDQELIYQCPNGVIAGVYSKHSNKREDRRFKFRCCRTKKNCQRDCSWTAHVNNWDGYMNYNIPLTKFLVGAQSLHDNGKE